MLLGAALFSAAAGFCIFPSIKREVIKQINACAAEPSDAKSKESLAALRRLYASKRINAIAGGLRLSGWLFVPVKEEKSLNRILVIAPEGRAVSVEDLCSLLERGILDRAGCGGVLPAVFIPKAAEYCNAGFFFSFGKKETAALVASACYFSQKAPQAALLFCGKGLGAFSAVFAAERFARRAKGGQGNFAGVVADLPAPSVAAVMRDVVAKLFPQRGARILVYAGARFASLFCGLGISGGDTRLSARKLALHKKWL